MRAKTAALIAILLSLSTTVEARSSKDRTIGIMGMGNIQLLDTVPNFDPGPGGGLYFDYRFNQRFSASAEAWATTHGGGGLSEGDEGIELMAIPAFTIKLYFMDDETSRWDPYAGVGLGAYAISEGSIENGTNGVGLGAHVDVGFDYYFSDIFSAGFSGVFRSIGMINSLDNNGNNTTAIIPFSLVGRFGFHF